MYLYNKRITYRRLQDIPGTVGARFLDRKEEGDKEVQNETIKESSSAGLVINKRYNRKDSAYSLFSENSGLI